MPEKFPRLFSPLLIHGHALRNRIVFGAHTANMTVDGLPTERHVAYYAERAIGGAAMIVFEPMPVHAAAVLDTEKLPSLRRYRRPPLCQGCSGHQGERGCRDPAALSRWSARRLRQFLPSSLVAVWSTELPRQRRIASQGRLLRVFGWTTTDGKTHGATGIGIVMPLIIGVMKTRRLALPACRDSTAFLSKDTRKPHDQAMLLRSR